MSICLKQSPLHNTNIARQHWFMSTLTASTISNLTVDTPLLSFLNCARGTLNVKEYKKLLAMVH